MCMPVSDHLLAPFADSENCSCWIENRHAAKCWRRNCSSCRRQCLNDQSRQELHMILHVQSLEVLFEEKRAFIRVFQCLAGYIVHQYLFFVTDYRELLRIVQLALEAKDAEENERKMSAQCSGFMHFPILLQRCQRLTFLALNQARYVTRFDLVFVFFLTEILAYVDARLKDAQIAIDIASPQSVLSIITLDMDFANVGALGTKSRQQFEFFLTSDLAEASGLERTKFEVKLVEPGSVVVHAEVRGDVAKGKTSQSVAEDLRMQANNPKSLLRAGQITRSIKSFVIKVGSSARPATIVHGQQEYKEHLEVHKEQLGTWVENLKQALIATARARVQAEAEVEAMTTKFKEAETETFALREKVGSMKTQLEAQDPSEQINQLNLELERERENSIKMQEKLKNIKELESEQMKRAQREAEELKARLLEASQKLQKSEEEAGRLKDRVSRLEALDREQVKVAEELSKSKAKLLQQKEDLMSLELRRKEEVAILESQKTRLGEVLAAGARRCADLEKEVARLEARVHEQDNALKDMQKEMSDLSESLTASIEARDVLQQKCQEIQGSCQRQLSELRQQLNRRCSSFEADVWQLQQRECELRQQVVDHLPVPGEGRHADVQSQQLHLESRLDALRCHLHEEEKRHKREVLRSNLPFCVC